MTASNSLTLFYRLTDAGLAAAPSGGAVACIEADSGVAERASAQVVGFLRFPQAGAMVEHAKLIELTNVLADSVSAKTDVYRWLTRLYGTTALENFIRHALLLEVDWLVALAVMAERDFPSAERVVITPDWPDSVSWPFVLRGLRDPHVRQRAAEILGAPLVEALDRIDVGRLERPPATRAARRVASAFVSTAGAWLRILWRVRPRSTRLPRSRVVLRTYLSDWESIPEEAQRLRGVDFVVDGEELRPEQVLVWAEPNIDEDRRRRLRARGYEVVGAEMYRIGVYAFLRRALPVLCGFTVRLPALLRCESWWHAHATSLVRDRIVWDEIGRALGPTAFLAYNDISVWAVSRNLMFHRHGIRTVFYQHSSGSYSELDGNWRENMACAYLAFSAIAAWGPAHVAQYALHPGAVDEFWGVGCLWSEHIRLISEDAALNQRYRALLEPSLPASLESFERVLAVIDATISSEIGRDAWLGTHRAALEVARRRPELLLLMKPKFPIDEAMAAGGPEVVSLVAELEAQENVALVPSFFETSAVVAFSDAVVGMAFSSVIVEAIGAGKPAFYIDPVEHFPHAFWRDIPGMVVLDADGLERRLQELLWDTDHDEYMGYLHAHLADVEGHFDGLAMTRLRRLLLQA